MPQEQTPDQARFERIEAAHETIANAVAALATDSRAAFSAFDTGLHALTAYMGQLAIAQTGAEVQIARMAQAQTQQAEAQKKSEERLAMLATAQAKSELAQAETQGKLNVLIHMWDNWIVENAKNGKKGNPAPEPPSGA